MGVCRPRREFPIIEAPGYIPQSAKALKVQRGNTYQHCPLASVVLYAPTPSFPSSLLLSPSPPSASAGHGLSPGLRKGRGPERPRSVKEKIRGLEIKGGRDTKGSIGKRRHLEDLESQYYVRSLLRAQFGFLNS